MAMVTRTAAQDSSSPNHPRHHTYTLIDIGTFGGPNSFAPDEPTSRFLNNTGSFTGCADTALADPDYPNFNFLVNPEGEADPLLFHALRWSRGGLSDLGAIPGDNSSCGGWMSDTGIVSGTSENGLFDPFIGIPEAEASLWRDGQLIRLGTLGGFESVANSVNSRGQAVGASTNAIPDPDSGFGTQIRAYIWETWGNAGPGYIGRGDRIRCCYQ
jgi:hypothetical protein